jgi:dihydroorotate dehydrogenase (NAD+) catalytic subunit
MLSHSEVDIIELNISCPNVKSGGMAFGIKSNVAMEIVKDVKSVCLKPLMVKLSPNAENIVDMALACVEGGANSLSLVNTFKAMAIDIYRRKPVFNNTYAGLSGAAIKPVALRMVHEVCRQVHVPVVGIGGIYTAEDAISFIMAGATAIQVGTANFSHPYACLKIIEGIRAFMEKENIKTLEDIRGIV